MTAVLAVMAEFNEEFEKTTEADIRRVQRRLQPIQPTDKALGTIHDENLKKMWTLAERFDGLAHLYGHNYKHEAETQEEEAVWLTKAARCINFEEIARDIFFTQAREDIGAWEVRAKIEVRADWMIVACPHHNSMQAILGGLVRLPGGPEEE